MMTISLLHEVKSEFLDYLDDTDIEYYWHVFLLVILTPITITLDLIIFPVNLIVLIIYLLRRKNEGK